MDMDIKKYFIKISFTLYPTPSRVGIGNLVYLYLNTTIPTFRSVLFVLNYILLFPQLSFKLFYIEVNTLSIP